MRRITQLFVNRPPLVFVLIALIALAGSFALATLVQQQFPNIDFPTINTSVSYPGASPSELRDSVVRPIEDAIAGAPDLDHINTSIQQNQASISATFTLDSNQTTDLTEVQDRLQSRGRAARGPARAVGAHLRSGADNDRHALGHLALAEHRGALGDRHEQRRARDRTSRRRLERGRQRHGDAGARSDRRSKKLASLGFTAERRRERDPSEQRARARRHRVSRTTARRRSTCAATYPDAGVDRGTCCSPVHGRAQGATSPSGTVTTKYTGGHRRHEPGPDAWPGRSSRNDLGRRRQQLRIATNPWSSSRRFCRASATSRP
jgi:hypothetical protein